MGRRPKPEDSAHKQAMFVEIGEFFKKKRENAGKTQQIVADEMDLTSAQYVSNIERGISPPSVEFLNVAIKLYTLDPKGVAFFMSRATNDYYLSEFGGD